MSDKRIGPRGGTTTMTRTGHVKKNLWMPEEVAEELRRKAFELRIAEAEIIRQALIRYLPTLAVFFATVALWPIQPS